MSGNESGGRARALRGWLWASRFLAVVAGVWVAVLLVPDFRWDGSAGGQVLAVCGIAAVLIVGTTVVVTSVSGTVESLLDLVVGRSRGRRAVRLPAAYGLALGGFGLAVAVLDGVRLEPGPFVWQVLTLVVLVGLFFMMTFELTVPFVTVIATIAISALKLWFLSWFSTGLEVTLQIGGFVNFVLMALIVSAAVALPALADRARNPRPAPAPVPDPLLDQPPMGPYY
ncbi:hypothetical protein [Nocardia asteroides]|uniref:hypothetical protein n=1 Tax=Nocardia asteroides TaxID=1824 RepID=UPI001E5A9297|nr:hypothetical protein [Nocardia asteroides]UGT57171.1 hypothetical protein LTT85_10125 [Nocardia asteroides]